VHRKHYLPDEDGFWEASWYDAAPPDFATVETVAGRVGFLICTEMWFTAHAIDYARAGVQILACPRATGRASTEKWKAGGVAAAVMSGAVCLSSNRGGPGTNPAEWGGSGWIIEPEEGRVLGVTTRQQPVVTVAIDPGMSDRARRTYPRYLYAG
jgi:N-carbamoylputrescine amidase